LINKNTIRQSLPIFGHFFKKMAKLHEARNIEQELKRIGADSDFMRFILIRNGLVIQPQILHFTTTKRPEAYQKRIKRQVQKCFGNQWRGYWKIVKKGWRDQDRMLLQKGLFKLEPLPPNPPHRPRDYPLWSAVYDLRNYIIKLTEKPKMSLIEEFLKTEGLWDSGSLSKEWDKRKKWFEGIWRPSIEDLLKWYEVNKERINEAIKTQIPIWERFEQFNQKEQPSEPKRGRPKKVDKKVPELIESDDYVVQLIAREDLDIQGTHYKEGEYFILDPKIFWEVFDKRVMEKLRVIPKVQCSQCGHRFVIADIFLSVSPPARCPQCGANEEYLKLCPRSLYWQPEIWV